MLVADDIRRTLGGVARDLWGNPGSTEAAAAAQPSAPVFPPFEQLWSSVDETVDWTEILTHDTPNDGLTTSAQWAMYRRYAAQVLNGDPAAYLAVLKLADPLKDLTSWAEKFDTVCVSADMLRVTFTAIPALLQREGERYPAGMSLRIARDLMALLPVLQVEVVTRCEGKPCMQVVFERSELQKVRFGFIDPVRFALQCGATFSG